LETSVTVHDGASSQEVNATELSFTSEGKGSMNQALGQALGSPRWSFDPTWGYEFIWREPVGLRGKNSNF
jgi:hypothetical protein